MKKLIFGFALLAAFLLIKCSMGRVSNYEADAKRSVIEWKGYLKNGDSNQGTLAVKSESLVIKEGKVQGGTFLVPLSSMIINSLPNDELKHQLVHHLQSKDFFDMKLYPEIRFTITGMSAYTGPQKQAVEGAQYLVTGDLTLLGKTNPVSFPARIDLDEDSLAVEGNLQINRALWGMTYASDLTSPDGLYIKPGIDLYLKIFAARQK